MAHYKSWSGLKKRLEDGLCEKLRGRISYFLTRYHKVHDAYGRAAVRLDGRELVRFSWNMMYEQESQLTEQWRESGEWDRESLKAIPHNYCRAIAQSDFSSDCTKTTQAG